MRVAFLSSTPPGPLEGSGTFVALDGLAAGLAALGHEVSTPPLGLRTGFHTLDRWLYNRKVALAPPAADLVVGVDLDGFLWGRRRRGTSPRFVVALKGVIADELRNERGWVRVLLAVQARWERANVACADRVIVPSAYSAEIAGAAYGIRADKIVVVPEPIDLDGWAQRFAAAGRRPARRPTVLSVARMYPRKRLSDLLEAARLLRARIPDVEVRIVGSGPESPRLHRLHAELGLGRTVTLLGDVPRGRLAVEYMSAHVFCLPTVQEGFGLVFAEAMAAGLPVVACRAAAVPEIVEDGRTGLLVPPRDPAALAEALEALLLNEARRRDLAAEGGRRVTRFQRERVAAEFLAGAGA